MIGTQCKALIRGRLGHSRLYWHRQPTSPLSVDQHAHPALFCYDALIEVFDTLDLTNRSDLATCARSVRVCQAWLVPASQALWRSDSGRSLQDLYHILRAHHSGIISVEFLTEVLRHKFHRRRDAWDLFLHYGSQIRALRRSDCDWRDDPAVVRGAETGLITSLIRRNHGHTFLPALRSAEWDEYPETRGALFSLVPPSLDTLDLTLHSSMRQKDIESFVLQLSGVIHGIHTLRMATAQNVSVVGLAYPPHLRHLSLDPYRILVDPAELQTLLSHLRLESLSVHISECHSWSAPVQVGKTLRKLSIEGGCLDLTAFVSHVHAPNLCELELFTKGAIDQMLYEPAAHRQLSAAIAGNPRLARTLRSLTLEYSTHLSPLLLGKTGPPVALFPDVLEPLVPGLASSLETLVVKYCHEAAIFTDDDVLCLAQACRTLKHLTLSLGARERELTVSTKLPTITALYHIAKYCTLLIALDIEIDDDDAKPVSPSWVADHPLRMLRLAVRSFTSPACDHLELERQVYRIFPAYFRDQDIAFVVSPNIGHTSSSYT
ncbi:hypothetical protein BD311DRAFT_765347 [Dichomitus squalens]|uniref:F-box domain-containing protein n=1 Tax=Dichomitus squalens TaxID=114155 RepID=A0A4Q9MEV0_9APHY|nr:hypothetical protein BD311DRAFT_765347 [Dichomitus squalens]